MFSNIDWQTILLPQTPLLETFTRGSLMYLSLFFILRVVLKRESGAVALSDLLVIVLLADAAQNGLADDYRSIPDGILLVITIIFWSYSLDWLGYRYPLIGKFIHPPALLLVRDGNMLRRNMRKEFITVDELMSSLREQGVNEVSQVKRAYMEGDGKISVITHDQERHHSPDTPQV